MAKRDPTQAWFLIGGRNLTGYLTDFADNQEAQTEDVTVLSSSFQQHAFVGVRQAEVEMNGFYDNATGGIHESLATGLSNNQVAVYGYDGTATGALFVGWSGALEAKYDKIIARGALTKVRTSVKNSGVVEEGRIIRPLAGATATGFGVTNAAAASGQSYDFGASNVSGGAGYLMITALDGASSGLAVDVMHSADNITFTSYAGFSVVSATAAINASYAQRVNSTAPVQRYVAERHQQGAGLNFITSGTFFVGFAPH